MKLINRALPVLAVLAAIAMMSDRAAPRDVQFDHQGEMVQQLIDWDRLSLYTAMPGIVRSYNPETRRASVQPALRVVYADDQEVDRPVLHNVQVVWPRGRHSSLHFRLQDGDAVLLVFSMAGLQEFRQTHRMATPDPEGGHAMKDAIAIPGFGAVQPVEAITDGDVWQTDDGSVEVTITESAQVRLRADATQYLIKPDGIDVDSPGGPFTLNVTGNVSLTASGNVAITAASVTHGGTLIDRTHTHSGVTPGTARTGNPQ